MRKENFDALCDVVASVLVGLFVGAGSNAWLGIAAGLATFTYCVGADRK